MSAGQAGFDFIFNNVSFARSGLLNDAQLVQTKGPTERQKERKITTLQVYLFIYNAHALSQSLSNTPPPILTPHTYHTRLLRWKKKTTSRQQQVRFLFPS